MIQADKIFHNGRIYTMEAEGETVSAVVILGGKIVYAGTDEEALAYPARESENLDGRTVLPGFIDTHIHISLDLLYKGFVDLSGEDTTDGVIRAMRAADDGTDGWLIGVGLAVNGTEGADCPNRLDLDKINADRPIMINSSCGHIKIVNSTALARADIPAQDAAACEAIRCLSDGTPSGVLLENVYASYNGEIIDGIDADTEKRKELIREGLRSYSEFGLTTLHTVSDAPEETQTEYIDQYFELEEADELTARIIINPTLPLPWPLRPQTGFGTEMVKMGSLKIFLDGAFGGRSAALLEPYSDAPGETGVFNFTEEELRAQIQGGYDAGLEVSIHAIGDAAMKRVLNAAESVYPSSDEEDPVARLQAAGKRRLRIVHAMLANEDIVRRLKRLPVILDVQPGFMDDDESFVEDRLGVERGKWYLPLRTYLENGIHLAGGSDYPFGGKPPLAAMQCAVTRKNLLGLPKVGLCSKEALTVFEAVSMFTRDAAYASSEENLKGTVTEGKFADLVVLDRDVFHTPPNEIADIKILKTIVGGRETYREA